MKAFIKVIHSSEGRPPADVEAALKSLGFSKAKGTNIYEAEVADEAAGQARIEAAHHAFKGMVLIYEPSMGRPPEAVGVGGHGYRDRMAKWKEMGLDVDELADLLQYDADRFRARGLEMFRAQLDRVAAEREREIRETEARERIERGREKIMTAVNQEGGQTFHQLAALSGLDEEILTQMLDEMVRKGQIVARQSGRRVAYVAAA